MSKAAHHITVASADGGSWESQTVQFECRGDRSSDCHRYPDCDCEGWGEDHPHPKIVHDECWIQSWFDGDSHAYDGEDRDDMNGDWGLPVGMNRSGEVTTSFEMDYIGWEFKP